MQPVPEVHHNRRSVLLWLPLLASAAVLALAGGAAYWALREFRSQAAQVAARARENEQLRRRVDQLSQAQTMRPAPPAPASPARLAEPDNHAAGAAALAASQQQAERLRESLAQSSSEVARLEARIADLESQVENLAAQNRRLTASGEDLKRSLADANQTMEKIQADMKTDAGRIQQLESANSRLQQESSSVQQSGAQARQAVSDLEEIFRRREMYLNNILRRYKDVTEQYRSLSGVLDSRRDRQAAPLTGTEISRVQNAIALAEEDLKQIQALNVQAQRLEKKLSAKQ